MILLPGANGKVGRVGVSASGAVPTVIDQAYGAATINPSGKIVQKTAERSEVQHDFGSTLDALPPRPISHTLYFENDSDILTSASAVEAQAILAEIAARPVADIVVIGHTDTMGDASYNDALSLQRAEKLRKLLIELGGDPRRISAAGRGERELLAPTSDEAPEPRNRRAEISVR
ncbi:MAG: OmpA family protein [Gammaproteobacteria bacterium]|nr:OmpA family protein [Gammaproteobacteria bacterium]